MKINYIILLVLFIAATSFKKKVNSNCIDDIIKLEHKIYSKKYAEGEKPLYVNYDIKTIDWENNTINSSVKIYRGHNNLHFFSTQANIYQDEKDILMVLKTQKIIVRENSSEKIVNNGVNEEFIQVKRKFLEGCELVKCENSPTSKSVKIVELKVTDDMKGLLYIDKMAYLYNPTANKLIKSIISYKKGYKVKRIEIKYNQLNLASDYKFYSAKKYVLSKKNTLLAKYSAYELIDNREEK